MITNDVEDEGDLPGKLKEEKKEEFKHRQRRQSLGGQKAPLRPRRESTTSTGSWCECLYPLLPITPHPAPVQYHASFQHRVPTIQALVEGRQAHPAVSLSSSCHGLFFNK